MGQKKSKYSSAPPLDQATIRRIITATSFLPDEIQYFYHDFLKYTPTGSLTLPDFERLYQTLFHNGLPEKFASYAFNAYDTNKDNVVDFEEFIKGLYYTTKASSGEKVRWVFSLCDLDCDAELSHQELKGIIQALYELSDADMARVETLDEAVGRIELLFLTNQDKGKNEVRHSITKGEFIEIVQSDAAIMKLIDCQAGIRKRGSKLDSSTALFKKQLKFKPPLKKSLSDSKLAANNDD